MSIFDTFLKIVRLPENLMTDVPVSSSSCTYIYVSDLLPLVSLDNNIMLASLVPYYINLPNLQIFLFAIFSFRIWNGETYYSINFKGVKYSNYGKTFILFLLISKLSIKG